jgi:hypothetical protein
VLVTDSVVKQTANDDNLMTYGNRSGHSLLVQGTFILQDCFLFMAIVYNALELRSIYIVQMPFTANILNSALIILRRIMYLVVGKLIYKNLRNDNLKYIIA